MKKRLVLMSLVLIFGVMSPARAQQGPAQPTEVQSAPAAEQEAAPPPAEVSTAPSQPPPDQSAAAPQQQEAAPPAPQEASGAETGGAVQYEPSTDPVAAAPAPAVEEGQAPAVEEGQVEQGAPEAPPAPLAAPQSPAVVDGQTPAGAPLGDTPAAPPAEAGADGSAAEQYDEPTGVRADDSTVAGSCGQTAGCEEQYGADGTAETGLAVAPSSTEATPPDRVASAAGGAVCDRTGCHEYGTGGGLPAAPPASSTPPPDQEAAAPSTDEGAPVPSADAYEPCGADRCGVEADPNLQCAEYTGARPPGSPSGPVYACYGPLDPYDVDLGYDCYEVQYFTESGKTASGDNGPWAQPYATDNYCPGDPFPQAPPANEECDPATAPDGCGGVANEYNFTRMHGGLVCTLNSPSDGVYFCYENEPAPGGAQHGDTCYLDGEPFACPNIYDYGSATCYTEAGQQVQCPAGGGTRGGIDASDQAADVVDTVADSRKPGDEGGSGGSGGRGGRNSAAPTPAPVGGGGGDAVPPRPDGSSAPKPQSAAAVPAGALAGDREEPVSTGAPAVDRGAPLGGQTAPYASQGRPVDPEGASGVPRPMSARGVLVGDDGWAWLGAYLGGTLRDGAAYRVGSGLLQYAGYAVDPFFAQYVEPSLVASTPTGDGAAVARDAEAGASSPVLLRPASAELAASETRGGEARVIVPVLASERGSDAVGDGANRRPSGPSDRPQAVGGGVSSGALVALGAAVLVGAAVLLRRRIMG